MMLRRRLPPIAFAGLATAVVIAAVAVRLALLGRQSYWIDELFSVHESDGSLHSLVTIGSTEVHTPFYAGLLWVWMKIGGSHETWTRLLSTLWAVAAVLVAHRGLRAVPLEGRVRWALTVATATSGSSIVCSLDTRNYALLLLGAVGLTAATVRAGLLGGEGAPVPRGVYLSWTGWATLAATAHLFGALLTLAAALVLACISVARSFSGRPHPIRPALIRPGLIWLGLAAVACLIQAGWLLNGRRTAGFAAGTEWIHAPGGADVWDLITTTFSSGGLTTRKDGFAWTSPVGTLAAVALCVLAGSSRLRRLRRRGEAPSIEARAAGILLALAAIVIVVAFSVSQYEHLWTLRNLVIAAPALVWGTICLAAAAAGSASGRRLVAVVAIALLAASLIPTAIGVSHPYKSDFRGLMDYLLTVRTQRPDAGFVVLGPDPPWGWRTASDRPDDDPAWPALYRRVRVHPGVLSYPGPKPDAAVRDGRTEIVVLYPGVANPALEQEASALIARLGPVGSCRRVPFYGLVVVRCN
jgi:hypothetical protein